MILDSPSLKTSHPFRKARELFEDDTRWKAVPDRDREELFHEAQVRCGCAWVCARECVCTWGPTVKYCKNKTL